MVFDKKLANKGFIGIVLLIILYMYLQINKVIIDCYNANNKFVIIVLLIAIYLHILQANTFLV